LEELEKQRRAMLDAESEDMKRKMEEEL